MATDEKANRISIQTAHTADLDTTTLGQARSLLDDVFVGEMTDADWEHSLGGMHALAWDETELVGHASVVQRRLIHGGRALRAGYVEGVGVRADRQGQGHAARLMGALERIIRNAYDLGALGTSDKAIGFYEHRGWTKWLGHTWTLTPTGAQRTEDEDGGIYVLTRSAIDIRGDLTCDWRDGDVW